MTVAAEPLRALYYPLAHPEDELTLKRLVLWFDEVCFADMSSARVRAGGHAAEEVSAAQAADWDTIFRRYAALLERGVVAVVDPEPQVRRHDALLSAALRADLLDDETWRLCTAAGTPDTMLVLRRIVPSLAFGFLNSQTYGRINYGTARARAVLHGTYMDWPDLRGEVSAGTSALFPEDDFPGGSWFRFLFHDGLIAREGNSYYLSDEQERAAFMDVEHTCVFPYTHASALLVNNALLLASALDCVLYCDSPLHVQLLELKRARIEAGTGSHLASFDIASPMPEVAPELLEPMDTAQILLYRDALQESLVPWKASIRRLLLAEGDEIPELVEADLEPEVRGAAERAAAVYGDLFGTPATGAGPSATSGRVFHGLSIPAALQRASDAAAGDFAPDPAGGQTASLSQLRPTFLSVLEEPRASA